MNAEFFNQIQEDWPHSHQLVLKLFLQYANQAVKETTFLANTRNPIFDTPNRPFLSGMIRFGAVDYFLERACKMNLLPGIAPEWIPLTNGDNVVHALELQGKHTSLIAHHLADPNDPPRGSILRNYRRLMNDRLKLNEQNPSLFEEDNKKPVPKNSEIPTVNLTLVHGREFAFIRIYNRLDRPKKYIPFSNENIMSLTPLAPNGPEAEQIADAEIKLKKHLQEIKKQQAQE